MGLAEVFESAVDTVFTVFVDAVKVGRYVIPPVDSGWGGTETSVKHEMSVIVNGLSQEDKKNTSFYTQIQPNDTIIMVKGIDIRDNSIRVSNSDLFEIDFTSYTDLFTIEAHDTDPVEALFIILLREKQRNIIEPEIEP